MKSWLITGGTACGKSSVTDLVSKLVPSSLLVFSADVAVSQEMNSVAVAKKLVHVFGQQAETVTGEVNRPWLREVVLPNPVFRQQLEGVLHPPVLAALELARATAARSGVNLFLAEVPLHYEIGESVSADFVIVVASSRSVQVRRMMENRGLDEQTVRKFLDAQWPVEAKVERADAVIWNDGSLASLEAQVLTLASPLLQA
jgi:dephospho-CoA kinase